MKELFLKKNFRKKSLKTIAQANDIITEYQRASIKLTLRQLYYQFVARGLRENTERSYKSLGKLINNARLAGLIDWRAIEDRGRNRVAWLIEEDPRSAVYGIERNFALDKWERQNTYVEVWVEKEALSGVIANPCMKWAAPYIACKGYMSASEMYDAGKRYEANGYRKKRVLIHLGDHDPSGIDMTRDNEERLEMFARSFNIEVRRIALNMDQVEEHKPPPNFAKESDSRHKIYKERYGKDSWELDALEPRLIRSLIEDNLTGLIDMDVWNETITEQEATRDTLSQFYERYDDIVEFLEND